MKIMVNDVELTAFALSGQEYRIKKRWSLGLAMSPLVVEVQPTTGKKLVAFPMASEVSTFNGDIALGFDFGIN